MNWQSYMYISTDTPKKVNEYQSFLSKSHCNRNQSKSQINIIIDELSVRYKNAKKYNQTKLAQDVINLTIRFIGIILVEEKSKSKSMKKFTFEDLILKNLILALNMKNRVLGYFNVKLIEMYWKNNMNIHFLKDSQNLRKLHKSYMNLHKNFHQTFCINLLSIQNLISKKISSNTNQNLYLIESQLNNSHFHFSNSKASNQLYQKNDQILKIKELCQKSIITLFRFIQIEQNSEHRNFLNLYLNQSILTKNFSIFYEIINNYFQTLLKSKQNNNSINQQSIPMLDIFTIIIQFFNFSQSNNPECYKYYDCIIKKFSNFLMTKYHLFNFCQNNFNQMFWKIINFLQTSINVMSEDYISIITCLYNIVADIAGIGKIIQLNDLFDIKNGNILLSSLNQKLWFFTKFYKDFCVKYLHITAIHELDRNLLSNFKSIMLKNISHNLIINQNNFIRIIDKINITIQKLKRDFLSNYCKLQNLYQIHSKKFQKSLQNLKQVCQIQNLILSDKYYIAMDNFSRLSHYITLAIIDIYTEWTKILQKKQKGKDFLKIIKKWIQKFNSLLIQENDMNRFYGHLINLLTFKWFDVLEQKRIQISFQVFELIFKKSDFIRKLNEKIQGSFIYICKKIKRQLNKQLKAEIKGLQESSVLQISKMSSFRSFLYELLKFPLQNIQSRHPLQIQQNNQNRNNKIKQILECISLLIVYSNEILMDSQYENIIKSYKQLIQSQSKTYQNTIDFKNIILSQIQSELINIIFTYKNLRLQIQPKQFLFFFNFYIQIHKIKIINNQNVNNWNKLTIKQNLKRMTFIIFLKHHINVFKNFIKIYQMLRNLEKQCFGWQSQVYVEKIDNITNKQLLNQINNDIQLSLNILTKKLFFLTHPQLNNYQISQQYTQKLQKQNQPTTTKQQHSRRKSKRQSRQQLQKQIQKGVFELQNSCYLLNKIKNYINFRKLRLNISLKQQFTMLYEKEQIQIENGLIIQIYNVTQQDLMCDIQSIIQLLGFTSNLIWAFKISDLSQQLNLIIKFRLGIFYRLKCLFINQKNDILRFQIDKLKYFQIINNSYENQQIQRKLNYNNINININKNNKNNNQSYKHKLITNKITQNQFIFSSQNISRIDQLIYLFNNSTTTLNFKIILSYISSYFINANRLSTEIILKTKFKIIPLSYSATYSKQKQIQQIFNQKSSIFNNFTYNQFLYPLLALILKRIIYLVKKDNQISQMKSLLEIILYFYSKTGLAIYFDQLFQHIQTKKIKINTIKIIDCYRILNTQQHSEINSINSINKININKLIFSKIDRMFLNKRRSISNIFNLKFIQDLVYSIKQSNMLMHKILNKIILFNCKQQFNLFYYQIFGIFQRVYKQNQRIQQKSIICQIFQLKNQIENIIQNKDNKAIQIKLKPNEYLFDLINIIKKIINYLPKYILTHYKYSELAQNVIGFYIQQIQSFDNELFTIQTIKQKNQFINKALLQLSLIKIDYNYEFKKMINIMEYIQNISKQNLQDFCQKVLTNKSIHKKFQQHFVKYNGQKYQFLLRNIKNCQFQYKKSLKICLQYPVSIIYPLRNYIYNISLYDTLIVTKVERFDFDYSLNTIQTIIQNDSDIITKQKSATQWWNGRKRLDRQMGKILWNTDLAIFDVVINKDKEIVFPNIKQYLPGLEKFIYHYSNQSKIHLKSFFQRFMIDQENEKIIQNSINLMNQKLHVQNSTKDFKINQKILILTVNNYTVFPFQKIKSLQKYSGIYRIPSISYLYEQQKLRIENKIQQTFNIKNLSFSVNISNDLKETERTFNEIKNKVGKAYNKYLDWQGFIGQKPPIESLQNYFKEKDIYLYMGHGLGTSHLKQKDLSKISVKSLLMFFGCSSISMLKNNSQMHGLPLMYLQNKCPSILGCLWDVTDKDTDMLTSKIFQKVSLSLTPLDFSQCVQEGKKGMKLPNLNGAAVVIYGMPSNLCLK